MDKLTLPKYLQSNRMHRDYISNLSNEQISEYLNLMSHLKKFEKIIQKEANERMIADGEIIDGLKVVEKNTYRTWIDPEEMLDLVLDEFGIDGVVLKSPAQIEKMDGGQDFVKEHTFRPDGAPVVSVEEDKRPPLPEKYYLESTQ